MFASYDKFESQYASYKEEPVPLSEDEELLKKKFIKDLDEYIIENNLRKLKSDYLGMSTFYYDQKMNKILELGDKKFYLLNKNKNKYQNTNFTLPISQYFSSPSIEVEGHIRELNGL